MATDDLQARIDAFPVWHYRFELDGATTPIFRPDAVNRHEQRRRMAFDPLVEVAGGTEVADDLGSQLGDEIAPGPLP